MTESGASIQSFAYQAQTPQGTALSGTIDAADVDTASRTLAGLQLRVTAMQPAAKPAATSPLRAADFLAFNQQLAQLTAGGLPIERSLRLLARDMRGKQAAAVNAIADELEKGVPLDAAFAKYASLFPPLYGLLIRAGIKTADLPAMLLNLSRHVEMLQRLRAAFWRAATYPLAVLSALLVVLAFLWTWVIPQFAQALDTSNLDKQMFIQSGADLSWVVPAARDVSAAVMVIVGLILLATLFFMIVSRTAGGRAMSERLLLPMPLVGPILRLNLLARWCDALYLAVRAGLDLPAALTLAGEAVGSGGLGKDSRALADAVSAGRAMDIDTTRLLPRVVPAALQMAVENHDLPATVGMLSSMYQDQAEIRLSLLPQVLSPIFMIVTAVCIGLALMALVVPMVAFIRLITALTRF